MWLHVSLIVSLSIVRPSLQLLDCSKAIVRGWEDLHSPPKWPELFNRLLLVTSLKSSGFEKTEELAPVLVRGKLEAAAISVGIQIVGMFSFIVLSIASADTAPPRARQQAFKTYKRNWQRLVSAS